MGLEGRLLAAFIAALVISLALGPLIIPALRRWKVGQVIREDGPARHFAKAGTPTMGGLIFLPAFALASAVWAPRELSVFLVLTNCAGFAILGFGDDYLKVDLLVTIGSLAAQTASGALAAGLTASQVHSFSTTEEALPFLKENLREGDLVLIKASRGLHLETLVTALREER